MLEKLLDVEQSVADDSAPGDLQPAIPQATKQPALQVSAGGMRSTGIKGLTFRVNQCRVHNTNAAIPHCSPDFGHKHVHVALPANKFVITME